MNRAVKTIVAGLVGIAFGLGTQNVMAREAESGGSHGGGHHGHGPGEDRYSLNGPWMILYKFPSTNRAPVTKLKGVIVQTGTNFTFAAPGKEPVMTGTVSSGVVLGSYHDTNNAAAGHIEFAGAMLNHQVIAGTPHHVENNVDGKFMAIRLHK